MHPLSRHMLLLLQLRIVVGTAREVSHAACSAPAFHGRGVVIEKLRLACAVIPRRHAPLQCEAPPGAL
eukprot:scaffold22942_cov64-Phaeocystis_antarctica.AAC.7